ncbi:MAG: hemin uptake protein HemP [Pirellula sp.]|nr:hemin uptake protein HemP [Pirellula sp.]
MKDESQDVSIENAGGEDGREPLSHAARCPVHAPGSMLNPLSFDELANGSEEVWIEGGGQLYRLRQTKQNKLILTK